MTRHTLFAVGLALLVSGPVLADGCRSIQDGVEVCLGETAWSGLSAVRDVDENGVLKSLSFQKADRTWLILSRIPEDHKTNLPNWAWRINHGHAVEAVDALVSTMVDYAGEQQLERFAPLGEDVAAATLVTRGKNGWINVYTYYVEGGATLSVQTGIQGMSMLTDQHRAEHLAVVEAVRVVE